MSRTLVTGAGGFVGANLVRALLRRGDEVHACVRPGGHNWRLRGLDAIIVHPVDMASPANIEHVVKDVEPDIVYHLAHYGGNKGQDDDELVRRVIVGGSEALYRACAALPSLRVIVHTGSSSEYGPQTEAMREDMFAMPTNAYAKAKVSITEYGKQLAKTGLPVTTLRLFSVYGPFEARDRLIPSLILNGLGMRNDLRLSSPDTMRDFVYVGDVISALLRADEGSHPGEVFNVGTGIETSISEVAELTADVLGTHIPLVWGSFPDRPFDTVHWRADTSHAASVLGWKSSRTLREGIKETAAWFEEHMDAYGTYYR